MSAFRTLLAALFVLTVNLAAADGDAGRHSKSWINIASSASDKTLTEGDPWEIDVEYSLDAADFDGGTRLELQALGPWVDTPDGKYEKTRHHVSYSGRKGCARS